jgi:hypothetical protein
MVGIPFSLPLHIVSFPTTGVAHYSCASNLRMNESRILEAAGQHYLHQLHSTSGTLLPSRVWKCSSLFFAFWNLSAYIEECHAGQEVLVRLPHCRSGSPRSR